jgi:hypothetical protein
LKGDEKMEKNIVCAMYMDLENIGGYSQINIQSLIEEASLQNRAEYQAGTMFAIKMAAGNADAIKLFENNLSGYNFDIRHIAQITPKLKNRADLILSMEALETALVTAPGIGMYIFLTRDSDFSIIMDKLRKYGKQVWLITDTKSSKLPIFKNSSNRIYTFDKFIDKDEKNPVEELQIIDKSSILEKETGVDDASSSPRVLKKEDIGNHPLSEDEVIQLLKKAIETIIKEERTPYLVTVQKEMKVLNPQFDITNSPFKKWKAVIKKAKERIGLEYNEDIYSLPNKIENVVPEVFGEKVGRGIDAKQSIEEDIDMDTSEKPLVQHNI